jgi:prephenate dehydrogenase
MNEPPFPTPLEENVVIVGVGLIGGSIAAAIKLRGVARRVIGIGRDQARIQAARSAGLIDEAALDVAAVIDQANLVIFCTPVDRLVQDIRSAVASPAASQNSPKSNSNTSLLLTDVGSVKASICSALTDIPAFVGSHPIAGSHRHGFEAADANLFERRLCVVTPVASSTEAQIGRLERFWHAIGMRTIRKSPEDHDAALAMTSHLPHVAAAAIASTLAAENRPFVGSGFKDTTRIAAGNPDLWTGILMNNSGAVIEGIDRLQGLLGEYRHALETANTAEVGRLLLDAQQTRSSLDAAHSH